MPVKKPEEADLMEQEQDPELRAMTALTKLFRNVIVFLGSLTKADSFVQSSYGICDCIINEISLKESDV